MFLTGVAMAKAKSKFILVRMLSEAGTGFSFNIRRKRLQEKLTMLRYDPFGKLCKLGFQTSVTYSAILCLLGSKSTVFNGTWFQLKHASFSESIKRSVPSKDDWLEQFDSHMKQNHTGNTKLVIYSVL